ncbi:hypothetical protein J6590_087479 [Homalodisca vitripennis]|nr:hypothetical protein J6590_087479 [Homalodisca vitripennis]
MLNAYLKRLPLLSDVKAFAVYPAGIYDISMTRKPAFIWPPSKFDVTVSGLLSHPLHGKPLRATAHFRSSKGSPGMFLKQPL